MSDLNLPAKVRAGDTLKFTDTVDDYPATDGWTLNYVLVNGQQHQTFSASGSEYAFNVALTTTKNWAAGDYRWQAYVDGVSSEKHTVGSGFVTILPDYSAGPSDQRSHVEKILSAIEATLEGKILTDAESVTINGRSIKRYSFDQLTKLRKEYKTELETIKRAEGASTRPSRTLVQMSA